MVTATLLIPQQNPSSHHETEFPSGTGPGTATPPGNAAVIWTVTATARMAGLNVLAWLTACLDECGRNGGKPPAGPALERFLPWTASPDDLRTWAQPPPAG